VLLVLSMSAMLAGCVTSGNPGLQRNLPASPSYAKPVTVADPRAGEDPVAVAARERAGRVQANKIITDYNHWYEALRTSYGASK
jgi:hypothetical protein